MFDLGRTFLAAVERSPEVTAVVDGKRRLGYASWYEEIARVQSELVSQAEMEKVQMQLQRQRAQQLYSTRSRANALGHFAVYYNQPELINSIWGRYERVTPADLQLVARTYFQEAHRTVVTTLPKTASTEKSK